MAVPVLKLNLVPPPTLWRRRHEALGWSALGLGAAALVASLAFWGVQIYKTNKAVKDALTLTNRARLAAQKEASLQRDLAAFDVTKELPRWKFAEKIYLERGLPWSRITPELERSLVDGVRLKALARTRGNDGAVELKLRGETRTREAEALFIENLQKNGLFAQVVLEREGERQGGGLDIELRLPLVPAPPAYVPLPKPEPPKPAAPAPKAASPRAMTRVAGPRPQAQAQTVVPHRSKGKK